MRIRNRPAIFSLYFALLMTLVVVATVVLPDPAAVIKSSTVSAPGDVITVSSGNWSDPAIWDTALVPQPGEKVWISAGHNVTFDSVAFVAGIELHGTLDFSRTVNTRLETTDNILVHQGGELLVGLPGDPIPPNITARIVFDVDTNDDFVGGDGFQETDTGLWVMAGGRWESHGAPLFIPWTDLAQDAVAGATEIIAEGELGDWPPGSSILITSTTPTMDPDARSGGRTDYFTEDEERTLVSAVDLGNGSSRLKFNAPLLFEHSGSGSAKGEVGLLSRNVIVESKSGDARAHTMYMAGSQGALSHTLFRRLGPKRVFSRYPVHFHQMSVTSIGKVIRGNVVWDSENHFFVVHNSLGIELVDNIGYRTLDIGYWLETTDASKIAPKPLDNSLIHNLAVKVFNVDQRGDGLTGFYAQRENNFIGNTAVSVAGTGDASGFKWPSADIQSGGHAFVSNESHSNLRQGMMGWQNSGTFHVVDASVWRNGASGIKWGAYGNGVQFHGLESFGNAQANFNTRNNRPFIQDSHLYGENEFPTQDGLFINFYTLAPEPDNPGKTYRNVFENHTRFDINHLPKTKCSAGGCIPTFNAIVGSQLLSDHNIRFGKDWESEVTFFDVQGYSGTTPGMPANFRLTRPDQPKPSNSAFYSQEFDAWVDPENLVPGTWELPPTINWTSTPSDLTGAPVFSASASGFTGGTGDIEFLVDEFEQSQPWYSEFFPNKDLIGTPIVVANKTELNFTWGIEKLNPDEKIPSNNAPAYPPLTPAEDWSARYTRSFSLDNGGEFQVAYHVNDGVRIFVDGSIIYDNWQEHNASGSAIGTVDFNLTAGSHTMVVEFFAGSSDRARLHIELYRIISSSSLSDSFTLDASTLPNRREVHVYARAYDPASRLFAYTPVLKYRNPNFSISAGGSSGVQLVAASELTTILVTPASSLVNSGDTVSFTASGYDQYGVPVSVSPTWSVEGPGSINSSTGVFTPSSGNSKSTSIVAQFGEISGTASVKFEVTDLTETVLWIDDSFPTGATISVDAPTWSSTDPKPNSGSLTHSLPATPGFHTYSFKDAPDELFVPVDARFITYVYIDPNHPASEIMLMWNDGTWEHRAYWGEDRIDRGDNHSESRQFMGAIPPAGEWVALEVPASFVGLVGASVNGMAFAAFDGRVVFDKVEMVMTELSTNAIETVWFDDRIPRGANEFGTNFVWSTSNPNPVSGNVAHHSRVGGFAKFNTPNGSQHGFESTSDRLAPGTGDVITTRVYLDPADPPEEVMLKWSSSSTWEHRAYWGENLLDFGEDGTESRRYMGPLPPVGEWVRLEVPAAAIGAEGKLIHGMGFLLHGGGAAWDKVSLIKDVTELLETPTPVPTPAPAPTATSTATPTATSPPPASSGGGFAAPPPPPPPVATVAPVGPVAPNAPSRVQAEDGGNGLTAKVFIGQPASDGGSPVLRYRVLVIPSGEVLLFQRLPVGEPYLVENLLPGIEYQFQVRTETGAGLSRDSRVSNTLRLLPVRQVPDPPKNVEALPAGTDTIMLKITAPGKDGGAPVTEYSVIVDPTGDVLKLESSGVETQHVISGLEAGIEYRFEVTSINSTGESETASTSNSVTLVLPEPTPTATPEPTPPQQPTPTPQPIPTDTPLTGQVVELTEGWNLIGFAVEPEDARIESVFADIYDHLHEVKTLKNGESVGWTKDSRSGKNSLTSIGTALGYWIQVDQPVSFVLFGTPIEIQDSVELHVGWNLIPYWGATVDVADALSPIAGSYVEVRGFDGAAVTYIPLLSPVFNSLHQFTPGMAYLINLTAEATLVWP